jgi:hypothetical protein
MRQLKTQNDIRRLRLIEVQTVKIDFVAGFSGLVRTVRQECASIHSVSTVLVLVGICARRQY